MCMIVPNSQVGFKIAKNDIVCYKILEVKGLKIRNNWYFKTFHAPFYDFKYKLNKLYKTRVTEELHPTYVSSGFHTFANKEAAEIYMTDMKDIVMIKAIIPKGSKYISGITEDCFKGNHQWHDSYVSDQIKILKVIK